MGNGNLTKEEEEEEERVDEEAEEDEEEDDRSSENMELKTKGGRQARAPRRSQGYETEGALCVQ